MTTREEFLKALHDVEIANLRFAAVADIPVEELAQDCGETHQAVVDAWDALTAQRDALVVLLKQARDALDHPGQHRWDAWAAMEAIDAALDALSAGEVEG